MIDSTRLAKLKTVDANGKVQTLRPEFSRANGRFCDAQGNLSPAKVRQVYMMAGLLSPMSDRREDLMASIRDNIVLLNAYLEHSGFQGPSRMTLQGASTTGKVRTPL